MDLSPLPLNKGEATEGGGGSPVGCAPITGREVGAETERWVQGHNRSPNLESASSLAKSLLPRPLVSTSPPRLFGGGLGPASP